jgi:hypothetical protein
MPKTPNYTDKQVARLDEVYSAAETDAERSVAVAVLAEEFGKDVRSIRAKLSHMGIYVKPTKVSKDGSPTVTKEKLATAIVNRLAIPGESGLEKANKPALKLLWNFVAEHTSAAEE